jgi:hypothetical protein
MIILIIEFITWLIDFFFKDNNIVTILEEKNIVDINQNQDIGQLLKQNLKKEIDKEIENDDFFKNFNDKYNNN